MSEMPSMLDVLREQGYLLHPIKGNSMMPLLDERTDVVKLVPITALDRELRRFDVPLYRNPRAGQQAPFVLHRILRVKKTHFVICGDNRTQYEIVPHDWVVAVAVGRYRGTEYLPFDDEAHLRDVARLCRTRDGLLGRLKRLGQRVFPPLSYMRRRYTVLARAPILLPLCYLVRIVCAPFARLVKKTK